MERTITTKLLEWKDSRRRKPLLLTGVRQCGKTYTLKAFGEACFESTVYVNFEESEKLSSIFDYDYDVERILREIALQYHTSIRPGSTLLILDEVQECPRAITSLKYFCENKPDLHVVAAGSLLGVALRDQQISFPVGKVNRLQMFPLTFQEFLRAVGEEDRMTLLSDWPVDRPIPALHTIPLERSLRDYYIVGGMPEAVTAWIETHDHRAVEEVQMEIIRDYRDDFAKHAPLSEVERIRWIWDSIPVQLAKENNKFMFSHVREGKRSAELEDALLWLRDAGLVHPLYLVDKPEIPLSGSMDMTYFKAYLSDIGLLRCRAGLSPETILTGAPLYMRFKGSLSENYALNEMIAQGITCGFWRSGNTAEVDLLLESHGRIVPVEVKAADNTRAKSYKEFCRRYHPSFGIKTSLKNIGEAECEGCRTLSLPLFLLWNWRKYADS
ncbi:MAG: ATP-binding protein [Clostridiales bacterium]|nr:ATP-binding protein [Clostridiales bacterium]